MVDAVLIPDTVIILEVKRVPVLTPVISVKEKVSGVVSGGGAAVDTLKVAFLSHIVRVELVVCELEGLAAC